MAEITAFQNCLGLLRDSDGLKYELNALVPELFVQGLITKVTFEKITHGVESVDSRLAHLLLDLLDRIRTDSSSFYKILAVLDAGRLQVLSSNLREELIRGSRLAVPINVYPQYREPLQRDDSGSFSPIGSRGTTPPPESSETPPPLESSETPQGAGVAELGREIVPVLDSVPQGGAGVADGGRSERETKLVPNIYADVTVPMAPAEAVTCTHTSEGDEARTLPLTTHMPLGHMTKRSRAESLPFQRDPADTAANFGRSLSLGASWRGYLPFLRHREQLSQADFSLVTDVSTRAEEIMCQLEREDSSLPAEPHLQPVSLCSTASAGTQFHHHGAPHPSLPQIIFSDSTQETLHLSAIPKDLGNVTTPLPLHTPEEPHDQAFPYQEVLAKLDEFNYSAHVYYTSSVPNTWKMLFAIRCVRVLDMDDDMLIHETSEGITFVEKFQGTGSPFPLDFIADRIELELPDSPTGWSLMCLTPPTIFQSTVDRYRGLAGDLVPNCQISVSGNAADVGSVLSARVHLRGAKEPFNYFIFECGPTSAGPGLEIERDTLMKERDELRAQLAVRSNSTIAMSYHRGMDVIAETSFDVTSQACTFKWEGHGLKLHFQQDSLPANCPLCRVEIRASLSGQYALPADSELVSGVYWIYCPVKLSKHATLEIQHCSTQREGLSFVRAECTQNQLPYDFLRQKYGTFLEHFSYGSIELFRFSGYGISQQSDSLQSHGEQSDYIAQVFYHTTAVLNMWKVSFTIRCAGRGLELEETEFHNKLVAATGQKITDFGPSFLVEFCADKIELNIQESPTGWRLKPLSNPAISRRIVDNYRARPGEFVPHCQISVSGIAADVGSMLEWELRLAGAKEPGNFCVLQRGPTSADSGTALHRQPVRHSEPDSPAGAKAGDGGEVAAPTMEEIIATIPLEKRNTPISSEVQIADIATGMNNWELISHLLGLLEVDVVRIKSDNPLYEQQKRSALRCWRDRLGRRATYEELMKIFHSRQDIRMVEKLGKLLCA